MTAIGTYATDYLHREGIAYAALGANTIEDADYPTAFADANGQPFKSDQRYVLHFDKNQIPPVRGFWSLTMYDQRQLFADNLIDRYAIGDRDKLKFNPDGSLDLYIQRKLPGEDREFELAACSPQRSLYDEPAALLAQTRRARRQLGAAAGEASELTVLIKDRDLAAVGCLSVNRKAEEA